MVELDTIIPHQRIVAVIFIKKSTILKNLSVVDCRLQHIQVLNNHTNGTKRGFAPIILEEYLEFVDGSSVKTAGEKIPFWDCVSNISIIPPFPGGFLETWTLLYPMLLCWPCWKNCPLLENIQLLDNHRSPPPVLTTHLFAVKAEENDGYRVGCDPKIRNRRIGEWSSGGSAGSNFKKSDTLILPAVADNNQPLS